MKKHTIDFSLVTGFTTVLVLLLFAGGQMYRSLQEYMSTLRWVEHSHLVLSALNEETSTMRELESGQRAYVLTHDDFFIAEYRIHQGELRSQLARIGVLTADNPSQQVRFALLSRMAEDRLQQLDMTVNVFRSRGLEAARDIIRNGKSKLSMDEVLKQTNAMENEERTLLQMRSDRAERNAERALRIGSILVAAAMGGLVMLWWRVMRETRKRKAAEEAVEESEQMRQVFDLLQDKNLELERTRSEAEKANLAKSEFLSSMSHELRSPLNAILGFAQLMESDTPPPNPAQKECVAQILQAGWHLLTLINEILDLAKVESRQTLLSNEPVSLAEVISECQGMVEQQALQRGIQMQYPSFDEPCFAMADRTRVKQVLVNLLSNAIKYNSRQGSVEVKCAENQPGRILISVRDTGPGLYPEQVEHLFEAFNRLGQEGGDEEGTGIGLVVAKRLLELMGGKIGVESSVGEGSVFWFELNSAEEPCLSTEEQTTAARWVPVSQGPKRYSLLYIEDNPANLKLVEKIIARHPDILLLTALNGTSGIAIAHSSRPDIVLMDINLPGMSGIEAMEILRSDPSTAHIPVIALSANAMPADIEACLKKGFFRYITKPIRVNEFMGALTVALEYAAKRSHDN